MLELRMKSTYDRVAASPQMKTDLSEYIGRERMRMTDYEIIMIFLSILTLLITFGGLLIALITFLDKRNK